MNKYKVKLITGQEEEFISIPKIVQKYGQFKGITQSNLAYHFSKCKKDEVYIQGFYIQKIVIN
jgi:hypothetical protein